MTRDPSSAARCRIALSTRWAFWRWNALRANTRRDSTRSTGPSASSRKCGPSWSPNSHRVGRLESGAAYRDANPGAAVSPRRASLASVTTVTGVGSMAGHGRPRDPAPRARHPHGAGGGRRRAALPPRAARPRAWRRPRRTGARAARRPARRPPAVGLAPHRPPGARPRAQPGLPARGPRRARRGVRRVDRAAQGAGRGSVDPGREHVAAARGAGRLRRGGDPRPRRLPGRGRRPAPRCGAPPRARRRGRAPGRRAVPAGGARRAAAHGVRATAWSARSTPRSRSTGCGPSSPPCRPGRTPVVHCCAPSAPLVLLRRTGADLAVDTGLLGPKGWESVAVAARGRPHPVCRVRAHHGPAGPRAGRRPAPS